MVAELAGNRAVIHDISEANRVYSKGCFGVFDGGLHLDLIETCYLVEKDRISVQCNGRKLALKQLMEHAHSFVPDFEIRYLVFRDMRERGYVVRNDTGFLIYSRGKKPPAGHAFRLLALSERAPCAIRQIAEAIETTNKKLLLGIVDEEGDVTYYLAKFFAMTGTLPEREYRGSLILVNDRCISWDAPLVEHLRTDHIGKDFGPYIQLSLTEAAYIVAKGAHVQSNRRRTSMKRFIAHAEKIQPDIKNRLRAYVDLRQRHLLPKTGFKFGSHFRVYEGDPNHHHAPYLVHVVEATYETTWPEVSRAVRLAHSVKKEMVFCMIDTEQINYIRLKRITP
jgi:tRNA-intron endonuclease